MKWLVTVTPCREGKVPDPRTKEWVEALVDAGASFAGLLVSECFQRIEPVTRMDLADERRRIERETRYSLELPMDSFLGVEQRDQLLRCGWCRVQGQSGVDTYTAYFAVTGKTRDGVDLLMGDLTEFAARVCVE